MIVDLLTCAHPHRSGLFDFVTVIAYSRDVTQWFKFRVEEAVGRISPSGHVPVLYVVNQDWVVFAQSFELTEDTRMPCGSVFRAQISGVSVLSIYGIHPTPINFGARKAQYAFDMSVCRACLMCPADPASAFQFLQDEDARNMIAMAKFLSEQSVSLPDLKRVRNSCLHRNAHFVQLHFAKIANLRGQLPSIPGAVVPAIQVAVLALQCDDYENVAEMFTRIGQVMIAARSVRTCDMFISLASCLVRQANAISILLGTPSCAQFCTEPNMRVSWASVLPAIGIIGSEQITQFLSCTTLVFKYIMVQGHSGDDIIATFEKTGILVDNIRMFLRHTCDLVFEYVINRYEEVVSLQKKMCMSRSQMVDIMTFGGDATFRTMLFVTKEQWTDSLAIQALLSTPQKFGEAMMTAEVAHGDESSMIALLCHGNSLAVQALLTSPERIATGITIFGTHNLADSGMIRVFLTHGGTAAMRAFLDSATVCCGPACSGLCQRF